MGMEQRNLRILLLTIIGAIYALALLFIVSPESYEWIVDFHFFGDRAFSKKEEREFDKKLTKQNLELYQTYYFNKDYPNILLLGFSEVIDDGRWTYGNLAKMSFTIPRINFPIILDFKLAAYTNQHNPLIMVTPILNGKEYYMWNFEDGRKSIKRSLLISPENVGHNGKVTVSFNIEGMKSPHELGYGNNVNKLGLFIEEMSIRPKH